MRYLLHFKKIINVISATWNLIISMCLFGFQSHHSEVHFCFSLSGIVRTVTPFSRPLLLDIAKEILVKKGQKDDESIHSFFSRRLGKEVIPNC